MFGVTRSLRYAGLETRLLRFRVHNDVLSKLHNRTLRSFWILQPTQPATARHHSQTTPSLYLSETGVTVVLGTARPVNITLISVVELPPLPPKVWVRTIQLGDMLEAEVLPVRIPELKVGDENREIGGVKGSVVVKGVVLDVPEVNVVDTKTVEDDDLVVNTETAELDAESEIGAGGELRGGNTEARAELVVVEDAVEDADILCVVEIDTVDEVLPVWAVGCDPLSVVLIETSLCVTTTAFTVTALVVFVMVCRVVVVVVLAVPLYPHHL